MTHGVNLLVDAQGNRLVFLLQHQDLSIEVINPLLLMLKSLLTTTLDHHYINPYSCILSISYSLFIMLAYLAYSCFILNSIFLYSATRELKKLKQFSLQRSWTSYSWSLIRRRFFLEPKKVQFLRLSVRSSSMGMDVLEASSRRVSRVRELSIYFLFRLEYNSIN